MHRSLALVAASLISSVSLADGPLGLSSPMDLPSLEPMDAPQTADGWMNVDDGEAEAPRAQIVGGRPVEGDDFKEVVYINTGGGACTGSLIDPKWVLTAAHCFDGMEDDAVIEVSFTNVAGSQGERTVQAPANNVHIAFEMVNGVRQTWDPTGVDGSREIADYEYDMALIELVDPIDDVAPIALNVAPADESWFGLPIRFVGFGLTKSEGAGGGTKRFTEVPVIGINSFLYQTFNGETGTCQGDSGGPGLVYTGQSYVQVSVTSHGIDCGAGPSGVIRVDRHLDWIRSEIATSNPPGSVILAPAAPPTFRCSHEVNPDEADTIALGVVPFDLKCQVSFPQPDDILSVSWDWGDGTEEEGLLLAPDHTYETDGSFNVFMCADYTVEKIDPLDNAVVTQQTHCVDRYAYVRACAEPKVQFAVEQTGPRKIRLDNRTDLSSYGCVYSVQWDIFKGDTASGEPVKSIVSWAPEVELEGSGTYTAQLHVGGLGGTSAAQLTFKVSAANNTNGACSHGGALTGGLGLLGLGLVGLRRRRD